MKNEAWQRCLDKGYDMSLVEANLRLSPAERLIRACRNADDIQRLRDALKQKQNGTGQFDKSTAKTRQLQG